MSAISPNIVASVALSLGVAAALNACSSSSEPSIPQGTGARLQPIASGLSSPLYLTSPPGDLSRLFVVEQTGGIRLIKDGSLLPTPFLDLSGRISAGGEQGLLGLAFYPDYATSGRFVVHYTDPAGDTHLSIFHVSADPDVADPASELVILTADQPYANHNGGQVLFGPDGFLYLGLGDGGAANDPEGRGQNLSDLLGSILRVDVQSGTSYTVPGDNPFVGQAGVQPEVWSYGLRNPWRFTFDRANGRSLHRGCRPGASYEEVDVAPGGANPGKGINYGWNIMEGCPLPSRRPVRSDRAYPAHASSTPTTKDARSPEGTSTGAAPSPLFKAIYFFADFAGAGSGAISYAGGQATELTDWPR